MERDGAGFFLVAAASAVGIILQSSMTVICNAKFVPVLREFVPFVPPPPPLRSKPLPHPLPSGETMFGVASG